MSDGSFIEILMYAALAGFVLFRLRSVLGKRTGHERPHDPFAEPPANTETKSADQDEDEADNVVRLPGHDKPVPAHVSEIDIDADALPAGITQIKMADPDFHEADFLRGGRGAFEMIVQAFAAGERDALKPLLSPALHTDFVNAIYERENERETQDTTIVSFRSSDIAEATLSQSIARVTVEFVTDQVKVTRDVDGAVVDGDPDHIETLTDLWTFERDLSSQDPNWVLVATSVPEE